MDEIETRSNTVLPSDNFWCLSYPANLELVPFPGFDDKGDGGGSILFLQ